MTEWVFEDGGNQVNTAVAASGSENIEFTDSKQGRGFNALTVTNRDDVDIRVRLNGQLTGGRLMVVPAGSEKSIPQENGETFDFLIVDNLDTVKAMTAGAVQYIAGTYKKVSD